MQYARIEYDGFNGVFIDISNPTSQPRSDSGNIRITNTDIFGEDLVKFLDYVKIDDEMYAKFKNREGIRGVWLKIPKSRSKLISIAVDNKFNYHHVEDDYIMLTKWMKEGESALPGKASAQIGVGGIVINPNNEILVVAEKWPTHNPIGFKIPTGIANAGEDIKKAIVREVYEETGVRSTFQHIIGFTCGNGNSKYTGKASNIYFVCILHTEETSKMFTLQNEEILGAEWKSFDWFLKNYCSRRILAADIYKLAVSFERIAKDLTLQGNWPELEKDDYREGKHFCIDKIVAARSSSHSSTMYVVDKSVENFMRDRMERLSMMFEGMEARAKKAEDAYQPQLDQKILIGDLREELKRTQGYERNERILKEQLQEDINRLNNKVKLLELNLSSDEKKSDKKIGIAGAGGLLLGATGGYMMGGRKKTKRKRIKYTKRKKIKKRSRSTKRR